MGVRIQTPIPSSHAAPYPSSTAAIASPSQEWTGANEQLGIDRVQVSAGSATGPRATGSATGWSVRIPAIGVDASVATFGVSPAGVMEVPTDATTVAWYDFTALPGGPGNAVLAAHVDWRGQLGVFNRIDELKPGAVIMIAAPSGELVQYEVSSVELVDPAAADVAALIGTRSGKSTLTMITCGGDFNRASRDYEMRVIVSAVMVGAPSASRS